ncbi:MAG: PSD1 and planctomycete cytochrome C domain-containing protein [Armatimonas sp.]
MKRLLAAVVAVFGSAAAFAQTPDPERFEKSVRPLLLKNCGSCHGGKEPMAGLRLDNVAGIKAGGPRGKFLDSKESLLLKSVRYTDPGLRMPPSGKLADSDIAILEAWVKEGAPLPKAVEAPVKPTTGGTPGFNLTTRRVHWAYQPVKAVLAPPIDGAPTDIDAFIRARLLKAGLKPSPEADKRVLLRRLTFDITGLPPTPKEMADFLADSSPNAYEKQVDRLLASPAYGERWGRHWLDLVRYGESMGHELDFELPQAWQYRDAVVRALNADVPYNQFVAEHLAGDLMDKPRRNAQTGINESMLLTGFWWLGEGKHSPVDIKQEQADRTDNQIDVLGKAFLGQTLACARCHDHKFDPIPTKDYYGLYGILASSRFQFTSASDPKPFVNAANEIAKLSDTIPPVTVPREALPGEMDLSEWKSSGTAFFRLAKPGEVVLLGDAKDPKPDVCVRPTAHSALGGLRQEGAFRSPTFTLDKDYVHVRVRGNKGRVHLIVEGFQVIRDPLYGPLQQTVDGGKSRWVTIDVKFWKGQRAYIELSDSPLTNFSIGPVGDPNAAFEGWIACDAALLNNEAKPPALSEGPTLDVASLGTIAAKERAIEAALPVQSRAMASCDPPVGADENVFIRGNHVASGPDAPRLALALCGQEGGAPAPAGSGRKELAAALTNPNHPLVARVIVNRIWKQHFGVGIVPTPDDFGHMGERPTHPELLDWLAADFVRNGWSMKAMHKKILMTATYRQSSVGNDEVAEQKDPTNALLHRANVRRLEGEAIRDSLLAVSGRLDKKMGGPSTFLYLTEFVEGRGRPPQGPLDGDGRRSIYLAVRRNFLSPWLQAFDFPTPFTCIGRRSTSNVPAQALALLNGPMVRQQANLWGEKLLKEPVEKRIPLMYETAFGRPPMPAELSAAQAFVAGRDNDKEAWGDLAHVLFNVKEFVFVR